MLKLAATIGKLLFFLFLSKVSFSQPPTHSAKIYDNIPADVKQSIMTNVDWMMVYAGNAAPTQMIHYTAPVRLWNGYQSVTWMRLTTGARDCGSIAILYAAANRNEDAITWLMAAQAHNPAAANQMLQYRDFALSYAYMTYKVYAINLVMEGELGRWKMDQRGKGFS